MAPANTRTKDTSTPPRHRSHRGCWTCKRKRIQCDETRPGCRRCTERGINCEGYEIRLRWGAGIASRGRFSGADKPVEESIPPPSKRRWDLRARSEKGCENDQNAKTVFLLEGQTSAEGHPCTRLDQHIGMRATVNILNTPYGESPGAYSGINKHFEVPVSADSLARGGPLASVQYGENTMSGRSALMA